MLLRTWSMHTYKLFKLSQPSFLKLAWGYFFSVSFVSAFDKALQDATKYGSFCDFEFKSARALGQVWKYCMLYGNGQIYCFKRGQLQYLVRYVPKDGSYSGKRYCFWYFNSSSRLTSGVQGDWRWRPCLFQRTSLFHDWCIGYSHRAQIQNHTETDWKSFC